MVDRAPDGEIEVAGGIFKHFYDGNWKLYIENVNDLLHPRYVHESSIESAARQDVNAPHDNAGDIARRQMIQNGVLAQIWDKVNVWTFPNGHSFMGDYHDDKRLLGDNKDPCSPNTAPRLRRATARSERGRSSRSAASTPSFIPI